MNQMAETLQSANVLQVNVTEGARVKLNEAGRSNCHERLHGCCGVLEKSDNGLARVVWDSVVMNSGSNENTRKGGPFVPRIRTAMSVIPLRFLEAE
jgi:hypothetical protein